MRKIGNMEVPDDTEYLGDGAYAWFDGWNICIAAERSDTTHWVALEPEVLAALNRFANKHYGTGAKHQPSSTHTARMLKMAAAAHDLAKDIPCGFKEARTIVEAAVGKLTDEENAELAAQMEKLDESDERDQT